MPASPSSAPAALPLARLIAHAADALQQVRAGRSLTEALAELPAVARPGAQALAFQALRGLGRAELLRRALAPRPPPAGGDALLLVGRSAPGHPTEPPPPPKEASPSS